MTKKGQVASKQPTKVIKPAKKEESVKEKAQVKRNCLLACYKKHWLKVALLVLLIAIYKKAMPQIYEIYRDKCFDDGPTKF